MQHTSIGSEILYDNGIYVGEVKDGKPHGEGTYKWTDGDVYKGHSSRMAGDTAEASAVKPMSSTSVNGRAI